jgi:hypothetical protein
VRDEPVRDQLMQASPSATQPVTCQQYWDLMDDNFPVMYQGFLSDNPTISSVIMIVLWQHLLDYNISQDD